MCGLFFSLQNCCLDHVLGSGSNKELPWNLQFILPRVRVLWYWVWLFFFLRYFMIYPKINLWGVVFVLIDGMGFDFCWVNTLSLVTHYCYFQTHGKF